ncbi:MAG: c-type cytochrome [Pseudomonadota bacterium]
MKKRLVFAAAAAMLMSAGAAQAAAGNAAAGQAASAACAACHGVDGNSMAPTFPRLAGQVPEYIQKQLHNFKTHERNDPDAGIMFGMAAPLDEAAIANLAAYFASQAPTKNPMPADAALVAKGKNIYNGGVAERNIPACAACHGPAGKGLAPLFPRLAGQHGMYVTNQLKYFKAGQRANDPAMMMRGVAKNMTEEEMQAVAAYLQSL